MMHHIKLLFIVSSLFVSSCYTARAQYENQINHLDQYLQKAVIDYNLPSLSIGIVKDGKVVMMKSYGVLKNGEEAKATEHSVYAIASLSKAFTTAALGMLVDEGKLKWDDRVIDHLPYFELADPYVTANMTIRDLCSHRCGLRTFDGDLLWYGTDYSREEIVRRIRHLPLRQEFRSEFGYQNIMYITAGEVVKSVSGLSWDAFVSTRILKPLDMDRTFTSFEDIDLTDNMTAPHLKGAPIFHLSYDNSGATAAIHSNVEDMTHWIQMWLNEGKVGDRQLLSKSSIREIQKQHTVMNTGSFDAKNGTHMKGYGLGWFLLDYNGRKIIRHGGGLPGYISQIMLVPEENLGMIVLTNDMNSLPSAMVYKVADAFTMENFGTRDWAAEYFAFQKMGDEEDEKMKDERMMKRVMKTKPSHDISAFTGDYTDKMYGGSILSIKDGKLFLEMTPTKKIFTATLNHWHYDTFQFQFADPFLPQGFITFELDSDGKVTGFTIDLPNPDFHFSNLHFIKN